MKILIFGRGAIGTQYGWALEKAGHSVEFYVRPGRKSTYGSDIDLELWDTRRGKKDQKIREKWPVVLREEIRDGHGYDLIILSVNPEQVAGAVSVLAPRLGQATLLFFCHFWHDPLMAIRPIPPGQIVWGFPGSGGGFEGNTLYGGLTRTVTMVPIASEPSPRDSAVYRVFAEAGFKVEIKKDAQSWRWNRFAINVAMEIEVLKSGSFKDAVSSRQALAGIGRNVKEIIKVLRAKGSTIDPMVWVLGALAPSLVGFMMSRVMNPGGMHYAAVEHNHFKVGFAVGLVIADARKFGIDAPRLYEVEALIAR